MFDALLGFVSVVAAVIAAVSGFGIGSLLTPAMTLMVPAKVAVAAVSIPHVVATAQRFWTMRSHLDASLLKSFGLMSALGGLTGAFVGVFLSSRVLELVLSGLIIFVGVGGWLGWLKKMRFVGGWAWLAGATSGFLGGLVGNQGGLRAGAMLGVGVSRDAFVATATATGLIVDSARMPVYLATQGHELVRVWPQIAIMTGGVIAGTMIGMKVLRRIPEVAFSRVVSTLLVALGLWLALRLAGH